MDKHVDVNEVAVEAVDTRRRTWKERTYSEVAVRSGTAEKKGKSNHSGKERTYSW